MRADLTRVKRGYDSGSVDRTEKPRLLMSLSLFLRQLADKNYAWLVGVLAIALGSVVLWRVWPHPPPTNRVATVPAAGTNAIAILPLQNLSGDLRFALADEVAQALTHTRSLEVRPTASSRKYVAADVDLPEAGRDLRVANVVAGHFVRQSNHLLVTVETINVASNSLVWQATINTSEQDLLALQEQLAKDIREGLVPNLGTSSQGADTSTRPKNSEAYDLYLRATPVPHDAKPNKEAIAMLERSVGLDPTYAPAWEALGARYYYDSTYGGGGEESFKRSSSAYERALALDPNLVTATGQLITNQVERGELTKAYQEASSLVRRHPDNAQAHFTMAYVYRYAGILKNSTADCDVALKLDPGNYFFRSCTWAFLYKGEPAQARVYAQLDAGSEWAQYTMPSILLREGKVDEARATVKKMPTEPFYHRDLLEACLDLRPMSDLDRIANQAVAMARIPAEDDPEIYYEQGSLFAYCDRTDAAVRMLRLAIEKNYCSYESLLNDPLLAKLRGKRDFEDLLQPAQNCQRPILNLIAAEPK